MVVQASLNVANSTLFHESTNACKDAFYQYSLNFKVVPLFFEMILNKTSEPIKSQ